MLFFSRKMLKEASLEIFKVQCYDSYWIVSWGFFALFGAIASHLHLTIISHVDILQFFFGMTQKYRKNEREDKNQLHSERLGQCTKLPIVTRFCSILKFVLPIVVLRIVLLYFFFYSLEPYCPELTLTFFRWHLTVPLFIDSTFFPFSFSIYTGAQI